MTQGYGPEFGQQGQQGQWGQQGQQPQWEQQPQWGQASPAPVPGGYPGSAGQGGMGTGPQFGPGDGVNWRRVKLLGLILLIGTALLLLIRLGINLASFIGADEVAATDAGGEMGALGIGAGLTSLVLTIASHAVGLILFVLAIIAAVMGRGKARTGGIMVAVAVPASVVLYWIVTVIVAVVLLASGMADADTGELTGNGYRIAAAVDVLRNLLIIAIIGLGSFFVHSTAAKKLSA
ncbi:MAG: hypothetical protein ACTIJK_07330 [Brachybacterium sp.]